MLFSEVSHDCIDNKLIAVNDEMKTLCVCRMPVNGVYVLGFTIFSYLSGCWMPR